MVLRVIRGTELCIRAVGHMGVDYKVELWKRRILRMFPTDIAMRITLVDWIRSRKVREKERVPGIIGRVDKR